MKSCLRCYLFFVVVGLLLSMKEARHLQVCSLSVAWLLIKRLRKIIQMIPPSDSPAGGLINNLLVHLASTFSMPGSVKVIIVTVCMVQTATGFIYAFYVIWLFSILWVSIVPCKSVFRYI